MTELTFASGLGLKHGYSAGENGWEAGMELNLRLLNMLVQGGAISLTATPPGSPTDGDVYLVAPSATGIWSGKDGQVAAYYASNWYYATPTPGMRIWDNTIGNYREWRGSTPRWQRAPTRGLFDLGVMPALSTGTQIGVSGTVTVVENPGRSISITNTNPPVDSSKFLSGVAFAVPTAPYRIAVFCMSDSMSANYPSVNIGWYDSGSGKIENIACLLASSQAGAYEHDTWNTNTSFANFDTLSNKGLVIANSGVWLGLADDGAGNVSMQTSATGGVWFTLKTLVKSSSFLGSSGYDDKFIVGTTWDENTGGGMQQSVSFLSIDLDGLDRKVG